MMLKQRVMDPRQKDEISEALAYTETPLDGAGQPAGEPYRVVPAYVYHHYPTGLRELTVGPNSRQLVGVTRFYPTMTPKLVIDFEPAPPDKWYEDEKRAFFVRQGIAYVPIVLNAKYSEDAFKAHVRACIDQMRVAHAEAQEDAALSSVNHHVEEWLQNPELMAVIDRYVIQKVDSDAKAAKKQLFGAARNNVIKKTKLAELDALRRSLKNGSTVDPFERYREPAAAAQ